MTILHVGNKPVYPLVDGGCVAMAALLSGCGQIGTVHHLAVHTPKHPFSAAAYPAEIAVKGETEACFIDTSVSAVGALKHLLSGRNYNLSRFYSPRFEAELVKLVSATAYDAVIVESLFLATYIPALRKAGAKTIIVRAHNVEHALWEQQAAQASFPKNWYLRQLATTLKREERGLLNTADQVWTITREDAEQLRQLGVTPPITTIPVAMALPEQQSDYTNNDCFHLGSLNWQPNQLAVNRLLTEIWPVFSQSHTSTLHIAGSFPENSPVIAGTNVQFHGFVEDAAAFMRSHGVLASPVLSGSGVRIKLLEAMAMGVPCITTPLGAMGIYDPETLVVADTNAAWLQELDALCASEDKRRQLGEKSRAYMEKYHSFAAVNAQIIAALGS